LKLDKSNVDEIIFRRHRFFVKRDDKINHYLSGNKYRKLQKLVETPTNKFKNIISYGGLQSNAMLSIAYMCYSKGWHFTYYVKRTPKHIITHPNANYKLALELNTNFVFLDEKEYENIINSLHVSDDTFVIKQGGAQEEALYGVEKLASEIKEHFKDKDINIITPSGTGTTAYFLAKSLHVEVFTTACVGNTHYLKEQISKLGEIPKNLHILETEKKYHFAKPYREFYQIYKELLDTTSIEFDLIYAPKTWLAIFENIDKFDSNILYIHSGGVIGNESMLQRYMYKNLL
jgi:1-aminocyclopropane-1-carboxylate deaminase